MNCYISMAGKRLVRSGVLFPVICVLTISLVSCRSGDSQKTRLIPGEARALKPAIDTSKVLKPLELYRAKRYEGIQEARSAGGDNVHKLILYGRGLETLPPEIGQLTYLASLDVSHNELRQLPEEISTLHYLQGFYATHNRLTAFPGQVLLLPVLTRLDLTANQISMIPPEIKWMDQLTRLTMDQNSLTSLPVEVYALKNLSVLELADNGLQSIPEGISGLKALEKLDLSGNQLERLPREITTLAENLKELNLQGNRIPRDELLWLVESMPGTQIRY